MRTHVNIVSDENNLSQNHTRGSIVQMSMLITVHLLLEIWSVERIFTEIAHVVMQQSDFSHENYVCVNPPTRANRPHTPGVSLKWVNRLLFVILWPIEVVSKNH